MLRWDSHFNISFKLGWLSLVLAVVLVIENKFGINQNPNSVLVYKIFDHEVSSCAGKIRAVVC